VFFRYFRELLDFKSSVYFLDTASVFGTANVEEFFML
jgi:hypothetical protein